MLACKRTLSEQGIDVGSYSPDAVAADVVSVAEAMGYRAYNIYGISGGTTLALTVMRDFPDNLRGVVLDGVLPPQVSVTEAKYANKAAALAAFFRHCEANRECSRRYPDLEQKFWQVVDRYAEQTTTTSRFFDTHRNEYFEEEVDGYFYLWRVLESLRSASWIPYVPFLLHHIAGGNDVVAEAFIAPASGRSGSTINNTAAWVSLWCYSQGDVADRTGNLADRAAHPRLVDPKSRDIALAICAEWHDSTFEPADRTPVSSDVPTLLLSGQFDPINPPRWAEVAAETLSGSYSFVVPMGGQGVGMDTPCGRRLVEAFLDAPSHDPSPACDPIADRNEQRFRTIYLNRGMRMKYLERRDSGGVKSLALGYGASAALAIHLSALIGWLLGAALRRFRRLSDTKPPWIRSRTTAAALIVLSVGFWWSVSAAEDVVFPVAFLFLGGNWLPLWLVELFVVFTAPIRLRLMSDELVRNFGYYPWVGPLFVIPYVTAAATLYVLYLAFRSWHEKWWNGFGRVHYTIVAITLAWYPFHLAYWGFIP